MINSFTQNGNFSIYLFLGCKNIENPRMMNEKELPLLSDFPLEISGIKIHKDSVKPRFFETLFWSLGFLSMEGEKMATEDKMIMEIGWKPSQSVGILRNPTLPD